MRLTHRGAIVLLFSLRGSLVDAQEPVNGAYPEVALFGDEQACPSPSQVGAALVAIVPSLHVAVGAAASGAFRVRIRDEGPRFVVTADGNLRGFEDPERDCAARARKAAVFLSLVLPQGSPEAPPPPAPPIVTPPPTPAVVARPPKHAWTPRLVPAELEIGGVLAAAPGNAAVTGGGALRLFFGSRYVGGVVAASGLAPVTLHFTSVGARITRVPFELGVRGRLPLRRVTLSLDATVVLGALLIKGVGLTPAASAQRIEVGVALTARAEYWVTRRLAPFLQFAFEGIPSTYNLMLPSGVTVGTTPKTWLAATAGLAVSL